ncbi:MAG TPA: hypothetical protein VGM89_00650 [Puia sp.]
MIAYNRQSLDNLHLQTEAQDAFGKKVITSDEYDRIRGAYPFHFYLPNFFIRIGFFILTTIAAACGLGLFMLMGIGGSSEGLLYGIMVGYGLLAFGALELFIHNRKMFGSGVDDALLWVGSFLIVLGIDLSTNDTLQPVPKCLLILVIALVGMLRYTDRVMTLFAYAASLGLVFYTLKDGRPVVRTLLPFVIMGLSIGGYFLFTRLQQQDRLRHYRSCLQVLRIATLLSLYLAGNYYIVRELNATLSGSSGPVALGWLWWLLTAAIPVFFIVKGIQRKDTLFLWTGMALVAGSVFTVRYYYHWLPTETAMVVGGIILIAGVYGLTRYLRTPKQGFTAAAPDYPHVLENLPVEGLVLAETFSTVAAPAPDTGVQFGGGTTGGGGAGGQF